MAYINKIFRSSFVDGPGNRIAIFMQGCNFNCLSCHNPETINLCKHCGDCVAKCPVGALSFSGDKLYYDSSLCVNCDMCIAVCEHSSTPKVSYLDVDELIDLVLKDKDFINGVTFSGGECTLWSEYIVEFTHKLKDASTLSVFLDTNGFVTEDRLLGLVDVVDGFMVDIKAFDGDLHNRLTTKDNDLVLHNVKTLHRLGKLYEIRVLAIPDIVDEDDIVNIFRFVNELDSSIRVVINGFRPLGVKGSLSKLNRYDDDGLRKLKDIAKTIGLSNVAVKGAYIE